MKKIDHFITEEFKSIINEKANHIIFDIYCDYFSHITYEEFEAQNLFHESVVMKCAAYRFADPEVLQGILYPNAVKHTNLFTTDNTLIHPIFYLRKSKKYAADLDVKDDYFLDGQPHYDRSFNIPAQSFWLALRDANIQTGGLCFFEEGLDQLFHIEWGEKNKYSTTMYQNEYKKLDPSIIPRVIHPDIKSGGAYTFDSNELHASTRPISETRLSFDFRVLLRSNLEEADERSKRLILNFNDNIALSNAKNLFLIGDVVGANKYIKNYKLNLEDIISIKQLHVAPKSNQLLHWSAEYSFID
tara:strand:- start:1712 stop:2614 length:903 start_codon:yes stop_codon:yes gene_type:complete